MRIRRTLPLFGIAGTTAFIMPITVACESLKSFDLRRLADSAFFISDEYNFEIGTVYQFVCSNIQSPNPEPAYWYFKFQDLNENYGRVNYDSLIIKLNGEQLIKNVDYRQRETNSGKPFIECNNIEKYIKNGDTIIFNCSLNGKDANALSAILKVS